MFISHAARTLDASRRSGTKLAVILLNLDRFKRINDSLSHEAGDQLLQIVAERISSHGLQTGTGDGGAPEESPFFAARSGGDEFMILLSGLRRSERISKFLRQLLGELARPVRVDQQEVFITARMGISLYAEDGEDLPTLLVNADTALSRAKREGGNCYRFYAKDMNLRAKERLSMEAQLNRAIDNEEFRLFYQPQINLATGALEGFEALLRWFPGRDRVVSPAEFIPILEETGLISPVGEWVLNAACSQLKAWVEEGYEPTRVAVNLSANQFRHEQLASSIQKAIDAHGVMPACLELELTETIIMQDAAKNRETLMALKEIGLRLSVDDFGTGYSSMSYLKLFPLDTLKIDRAFVMELEKGTNDESIVRAIVALSKGLGLNSVAEGVETVQQRELLAHLGCDIAQGFLISKPVPAQDAAAFLRANGKSRHLSHGGTERLGNNSLDGDPSPISLDLAR
jgi:diguanylate cyclase (GGDEF)-like protein